MTIEEALIVLDSLMGREQLTHLQETVFCRSWDGQTYEQIAGTVGYDSDYVKLVGSQLWQSLSDHIGQRVTKNNFRVVLRQQMGRQDEKHSDSSLQDWGELIDTSDFCGRSQELTELEGWIVRDKCRLVTLLGMGGIGKTVLSIKLAERLQKNFECVIWRSLRDAPPLDSILSDLIQFLSHQQETELPESVDGKLGRLLHYLRQRRCLVILDNVESILGTGEQAGHYPIGYESYGELFRRVGETVHQSCVVMTSREKPREVAALEGTAVRSFKLTGLDEPEARELLKPKSLSATTTTFEQLIDLYAGNPLALKIAAATIQELFDRDVAEFLRHGTAVFGDISNLLDQQFDRLSDLEKQIMCWLAINREGTSIADLAEDLVPIVPKRHLMDALASLARRPLIEKQGASFTLQPVVMEYVAETLIDRVCQEILTQDLHLFVSHALLKADVEDQVRESQMRMIVQPLLDRLTAPTHCKSEIEKKLKKVLLTLQNRDDCAIGYGAGNVINLLRQLHIDLTGYDFSNLSVWQAYLQGATLHQVNFSRSDLSKSVFSDTLGNVWSVAFSPDGRVLAASDTAGEIHLWQICDRAGNLLRHRQKLLTCQGHHHWVCSIAFSPDGQTLISGSVDKTVKLWDVNTGDCLQTFEGHRDWLVSVAFSPLGLIVASSSVDRTIRLWDLQTGKCLRILEEHQHWVCSIAFSPDGQTLISGSDDKTLKLWNIGTGDCLKTLKGHTSGVRGVAFSPDGQTVVSGSQDHTVKLWNLTSERCLRTLAGHTNEIRCVSFSPDGQSVASSSFDRTLKLWDWQTGQCLKTLQGHTAPVRSVSFSPDGQMVASGSADQSVRLWNRQTGECLKTFQGYTNFVLSVAFSPDSQTIGSTSADHTLKLWDREGQCLKTMRGHSNWVWSVAFSPDGQTLASGSFDQTIRLWDRQTGQCLKTLHGHSNWVWSVAFSPNGQRLVSSGFDQTVRLWDTATGDCLRVLNTESRIWSVAFSPDGERIAIGLEDHHIQLWNPGTDAPLTSLTGHTGRVCSVTFSRDQQTLLSSSDDHTVKRWSLHTGDCLQTLDDRDCVKSAIFSADEKIIISGGLDHTLKFWNATTGVCEQTLQGHRDRVWSVACSRDGTTIASASEDETLRLWDAKTGACLHVFRNPRPYEGMNITNVTGLTDAQKATLETLGAIDVNGTTRETEEL